MNLFYRSCILFLTTVVFLTTTCFAVDVHYCEDEIQSIAFFKKAEPCSKMKEETPKLRKCCLARKAKLEKELKGKAVAKKKKCCSNKSVGFKADTQNNTDTIELSFACDAIVTIFTLKEAPSIAFNVATNSTHRAPPDRHFSQDFQILYQVFQI